MDQNQIKYVIEAALLAAGRPLTVDQLRALFGDEHPPERNEIRQAVTALESDYADRGIAIGEVASGFRIQVRPTMTPRLARLWEERAPRYSRALMETLAIVAYRQPVTRGDIEDIRGVAVTPNVLKVLEGRGWIDTVGHRDTPGRPALYATTKRFLDDLRLRSLAELPPLTEIERVMDLADAAQA